MKIYHNEHTSGRVDAYVEVLIAELKQYGVLHTDQIDDLIKDKFSGQWTAEDRSPIKNKKGTTLHEEKWRNDVDFAKAYLTNHGITTRYYNWYILLPETKGNYEGKSICDREDAMTCLIHVVRTLVN